MSKGVILLSAGGTGGHLFPAEALAHELVKRGWDIHLATDSRAERFTAGFPASAIHSIRSATIGSKNPLAVLRSFAELWSGFRQSSALIAELAPLAVVGFGGYPTLPPVYAAVRRDVPTVIHEQNAVMGRANKALAGRVSAIAGGLLPASGTHAAKIVEVGNPVRSAVLEVADTPYAAPSAAEPIEILIFGGSQGARFFSDVTPDALGHLAAQLRSRLRVTQQARAEDETKVRARYAELGIEAEVAPFFADLPARMARSHLVVSRGGASTVLELSVIGRPAIIVPLPHALDDDQGHNAQLLVDAGGALMLRQQGITAESLSADIASLVSQPDRLAGMAASARSAAKPEATRLLADLVEAIAGGRTVEEFKKGIAS